MDKLLKKIDAFLEKHGISESYLGVMSVSDSNFVNRLRSGGECLPRTEKKIIDFMANYAPKRKRKAQS